MKNETDDETRLWLLLVTGLLLIYFVVAVVVNLLK